MDRKSEKRRVHATPSVSMALVLSPSLMSSILRPSPSTATTSLPALQMDISSSSSSSDSYPDFHHTSSAPSTRRIRFAPLPDPHRDLFDVPYAPDAQANKSPPLPAFTPEGSVSLSPSLSPSSSPSSSPDLTGSSARSTPTIRTSPRIPSKNSPRSNLILRPFSFLRRVDSSPNRSPLSQSSSLPGSRNLSVSSLTPSSSSVPCSPSSKSRKLPRISAEDIFTLGAKSLFRSRSGSASSTPLTRVSSPPPRPLNPTKFLHRSASTGSGPNTEVGNGRPERGEGPSQSRDNPALAGSGPKKRRASSSSLTPGAGGGRHTSMKMPLSDTSPRPSTAPGSPFTPPKKHFKMLNGRVYGAKRYAAQTLANPFANVRDEPEFVEWGYGGMGSVHASAGIGNDIWKGLQRSERGGALLAGSSSPRSPPASTSLTTEAVTVGGGRGKGARPTSPVVRRKMTDDVPECGMGNVMADGELGDDAGSGMGWVKRRRAEREAKARLEQEAKELENKAQEGLKSGDSMDASMYASTASTTTSLTACTSAASTDLTTPTTSPPPSRSSSTTDLKLTSSPPLESCDPHTELLPLATGKQSAKSETAPAHPISVSKDEYEHHVLTAVRLSPAVSGPSHKHNMPATHSRTPSLPHSLSQINTRTDDERTGQVPPLSPVDTEETTTSANSSSEEDAPSRGFNKGEEQDGADDDEEDEAQDYRRKTALGAGVEKISRHVDVEAR